MSFNGDLEINFAKISGNVPTNPPTNLYLF